MVGTCVFWKLSRWEINLNTVSWKLAGKLRSRSPDPLKGYPNHGKTYIVFACIETGALGMARYTMLSRSWFRMFFMFAPGWGDDPS